MSQAITICHSGPSDLEYLGNVLENQLGSALTRSPAEPGCRAQLQVESTRGDIVVIRNFADQEFAMEEYFDNDDLDHEFREITPELTYLSMRFRDIRTARWVLEALLSNLITFGPCWVDSDYGWVRPGTWFLECMRQDPDWDWRADPAPEPRQPSQANE